MFNSHKKLVLYSKGTKIIYIDTDQTVAHFNILEALAHGDEELSDIIYKLADVLEQQVNVKY
jgi:hypothetical protein